MALGIPTGDPVALNGTTPVVAIPSPSSGTQHIAQTIVIYNGDTVSHDFTLELFDGTSRFPIQKQSSVAASATVRFDYVYGLVADDTTDQFRVYSNAAATTTEPTCTPAYIVNTN